MKSPSSPDPLKPSFRTGASRRFFFPVRSREPVGLRREKSLFRLFATFTDERSLCNPRALFFVGARFSASPFNSRRTLPFRLRLLSSGICSVGSSDPFFSFPSPVRVLQTTMTQFSKVDLVGVGLNATDTFLPVRHFPERGSKVEIHSAIVLPGGQVATAVVACQQWGLRTRYIGKVGDDAAAAIHRAEFARLGVEAQLLTAAGCPSQQAFILVDESGERTVLWKRDELL